MSVYFHLNVLFVYDFLMIFLCWYVTEISITNRCSWISVYVYEREFVIEDDMMTPSIQIFCLYIKSICVCVLQVHNPWFNLGVSFSCSCFSCCLAATVLYLLVVAFFCFGLNGGFWGKRGSYMEFLFLNWNFNTHVLHI